MEIKELGVKINKLGASMALVCLFMAGQAQAARAAQRDAGQGVQGVQVHTADPHMASFGYQVQACEDANAKNCSARLPLKPGQPVELFIDRIVSARRSGPEIQENLVPIKAYDLLFFAQRVPGLMEQVATLEDVRPGSTVECHDGKAFVQGKTRKQAGWTPIRRMRQRAKITRPKLVRLTKNARPADIEAQAERLEDLARDIDSIDPATLSTEDRQKIVFYRAQATELRRQVRSGNGLGEAILETPEPSYELEDKRLDLDYPYRTLIDMH